MVKTNFQVKKLTDGLYFGEAPRWRDGKLYFADMIGQTLYAVSDDGHREVIKELPNQPNGMDFNKEGILIYSTMFDKQLWSYDPKTKVHKHYADMSELMQGYTGDAVIDSKGRMYMDDVGARVLHGEEPRAGRILLIEPTGEVKVAHEDLVFPNGITIDSTGKTLWVVETFTHQLNRFKIRPDGALYDREIVWDLKEYPVAEGQEWTMFHSCDGFCMDAEDGIWMSMLAYNQFIRRDSKTGEISDVIQVDGEPTACTLGGEDGKTLYLVVNKVPRDGNFFEHMKARNTQCTIYTTRVEIGKGKARP